MSKEVDYQAKLIRKLHIAFPGCFVIKNDPTENQGIPDLLVLFGTRWAMLECKVDEGSSVQPNQVYYIDMFSEMSFAAFISPMNEDQVLYELQSTFGVSW